MVLILSHYGNQIIEKLENKIKHDQEKKILISKRDLA